ncbi:MULTISPECIES: TAXI family TRAP transporter solute-binding subunit [unclassified Streptomyces]|uniref:TAXI family TRAP transporter solute-binding subunit n=1 Tax=unclassified Streptomyces TaxID=2593676 RepID=UPI0005ECDB46|nr:MULTISPECIES: TAXI family TRAP transporter solute-binding subunit [unclassified Streptomyces]APU38520.1 C4-dicarboxylate ABC transporter substrate-binding protein [Streptomyces sp. TN58]APU43946.1 C4-dicarboxylate ABC transporter substrate-binding protein [Streptomyces sp. TN58]
MKYRIRAPRLAVAALVAALAVTACGGGKQTQGAGAGSGKGGRLTIATGPTTGVYYQIGGGLAKLISDDLDGYRATATTTGASVQNIQGLGAGTYDIAFSLADTAGDAVNGRESFSSPQQIEALTRLYPNYTQVLVRADSGIKSLQDMKGKRVSTGAPGSGTEVIAHRLLKAAGLAPTDVTAERLGLAESVDAMKDGTVQALFWSGGLPTGGITDLTTSLKDEVRFLDVTAQLPSLNQQYGDVYQKAAIPAAAYHQPQDVPTIAVPNVLLVKKGFDPELAEKIVHLLYEKKGDLEKVNAAAKEIEPSRADAVAPVPLNAGARTALKALAQKP